MREQVRIETADGSCPCTVLRPEGGAALPAVLFFMDAFGIRPALLDMAERLANNGYVVLLPDLYFRMGSYAPMDPRAMFADPDFRKTLAPFTASTTTRVASEDTAAFLAYLDRRDDVAGDKVGATGYCMGGGIALAVAGTYPARIAAVASFHGGNLATDSPLSPHTFIPGIRGFVYVAGADRDASYPPGMAERLESALTTAGVAHRCEIYAEALHGWTMTDFPVHHPAAAQRHWRELTALFARTLR